MFLPNSARRARPGKTLVMFVLFAPVLLGMIGLVIDGSLLMAAQRQAQNAADAAALAAAQAKLIGASDDTAVAEANTFLTTNGVTGVTLVKNAGANNAVNFSPNNFSKTSSPYNPIPNYVEVIVTRPVYTLFIQVLGVNSNQQVTARAAAGFEPVGAGQGVMVLDTTVAPGLSVAANASGNNTPSLTVNGNITVNSPGGRGTSQVDQFGAVVAGSSSINGTSPAVSTSNTTLSVPAIVATDVQVVGGVDTIDNIRSYDPSFVNNYDPNDVSRPIFARAPVAPDPLGTLVTPMASNGVTASSSFPSANGGTATTPQAITVTTGQNVTLNPGIYQSISINGGSLTFNPGIYVVGINSGNGNGVRALDLSAGTVTGNGVLFYNTGGSYTVNNQGVGSWGNKGWNPTNGGDDANDLNNSVGSTAGVNFGSLNVNGSSGSSITLTPYNNANNANDPFNDLMYYQRRWNTTGLSIQGNAANVNVGGTWYAKWANFQLGGNGTYNAQFLVGSMTINGGASVTINATGKFKGRANLVFLVE
jgi:Flp pilus assembly protein TadG